MSAASEIEAGQSMAPRLWLWHLNHNRADLAAQTPERRYSDPVATGRREQTFCGGGRLQTWLNGLRLCLSGIRPLTLQPGYLKHWACPVQQIPGTAGLRTNNLLRQRTRKQGQLGRLCLAH
jgi:hypothetical protein